MMPIVTSFSVYVQGFCLSKESDAESVTQAKERPTAYSKSKATDDGNSCRADRFFLRNLS